MIILYYIEGIDRENIPYVYPAYKTQTTISDYLREHEVATIPNSYYPPYYKNIISISSEDFTGNFLETSINYLGIVFGNKTYYYFIDRIVYVNEDLYKLHITMDVIMTYINDIKVHSGIIERKFINRYDSNNNINRKYLRENCSKGIFQLTNRTYLNDIHQYEGHANDIDDSEGVIVVRTAGTPWLPEKKDHLDDKKSELYSYRNIDDTDLLSTKQRSYIGSYISYMMPYNKHIFFRGEGLTYCNDNPKYPTTYMCAPVMCMHNICSHPSVVDIRYYPINLYNEKIRYEDATKKVKLNYEASPQSEVALGNKLRDGVYDLLLYCSESYTVHGIKYKHILPIVKNENKGVLFYSTRVPALIDENYIRLSYGDGMVQSTIQLYYLKSNYVYCNYNYDINSGAKYYWFTGDYIIDYSEPKYGENNLINSLAINENAISMDLINDNWKTWTAYNSATLPLTIGKNILDVGKFAFDTYTKYKFPNERLTTDLLFGDYSEKMKDAGAGIENALSIPSRYENIINNSMAPNTAKSGGTYTSYIINESMNIRLDEYRVNDYEQCAQYYHRYGYLVDEYINEVDNIFDYVSTRYYYNILKMREADISLVNSPASTEVIELIKQRLEKGIRLWNCDDHNTFVEIGNYTYDNVERSYLNE